MAAPKKKQPAGSQPAPKENKAKTAFDEYKNRMNQAAASQPVQSKVPKQPAGPPGDFPGMGYGGYPPPSPGMMPPPFPPGQYNPPEQKTAEGAGGSVFESLGKLFSLGIELLSSGITGSQQLMQGFSGGQPQHFSPDWHGSHYHPQHDCCDYSYSHYYEDCCNCRDCHPGVHNCG